MKCQYCGVINNKNIGTCDECGAELGGYESKYIPKLETESGYLNNDVLPLRIKSTYEKTWFIPAISLVVLLIMAFYFIYEFPEHGSLIAIICFISIIPILLLSSDFGWLG